MMEQSSLIGELGSLRETGGNLPIPLDRADRVWMVERGQVDVFSVRLEDGRPMGLRRPFFTVHAGDILFGMEPRGMEEGRGMLAVGAFGTFIREIDDAEFLRLGLDPSKADDIQRLIRRWIRTVSLAVGGREMMPRNSRDLYGEGLASIEAGGNVHPTFKTLWVRVESGRAAFLGQVEFPELAKGQVFPLAKETWLQALEGTTLSYREEWPSLERGDLGCALRSFSAFIQECAAVNAARMERSERARMLRRTDARKSLSDRALSSLSAILKPAGSTIVAEADPREPLLAACRIVGRASGIELRSPGIGRREQGQGESLEEIGRASGFRTRQVSLRGDWWKRDNGPLLVYREADERPMAAIPTKGRRCALFDPVEGTIEVIDQTLAESLSAKAHTFYRSFPEGPLSGIGLVRFGLRACRSDIATALLVGLGGALLSLLAPWMTGLLFDAIIPEADGGQLLQLASILVVGALATLMFDVTRGIALVRVEGRMDGAAQAALWDRLLALPVPFFANYSAGDLAERSMGISGIRSILSGLAVSAVLACLFSLANLGLLFHYSPSLAWVAVGLCAVGLAFVLCVSVLLVRRQRRVVELDGENLGTILQLITGIAKLRICGAEEGAFSRWAETFAEKKKQAFRAGRLQSLLSSFNAVYPVLTLMAIFMWLTWKLEGGLSTGAFLAFAAAFASLQNALLQMGTAVVMSLSVFPIYDRLKPIITAIPEADENKEKPGLLSGRIEANRLTYRYDPGSPLVLKDVSLSVGPGEFVAIVGSSGSGKSTLLRLLLGFASPDAGAIYYDGQDLASLDLPSVRRQIGVVLQNGQVMAGDIRGTILGSSKLGEDEAWEAARMVGLDQDIREMPMGMHTMIPSGGGTLSGGQRQRLVIARAIVRKPRILFFDEATSALDNRTQAIVAQSLEGLKVSRLVIAHRLSTIMKADRIYVLDGGEIAEIGGYDELMGSGGPFSELAKRQVG